MEHLDLAGYLNTPVNWNLGAFEQQDAIYLSSSRQMLEPIMEETSEDEEHAQGSWNGCEPKGSSGCGGFWSSAESETGSVIRVEVNKDIDAISERDFACPPKRARRSQDEQLQSLEDVVQLRRPPPPRYDSEAHNSLERFLALEACARDSFGSQGQRHSSGSTSGSRRGGVNFEDFYSDNDSYHSLSRSSSLVQFESLERQLTLQEQHQSMNSLGNSSPSLLSCETVASSSSVSSVSNASGGGGSHSNPDSRRGSATSLLKRYESSDGRLHQTYYELNKLTDFEQQQQRVLFGACKSLHHQAELKSDSESSSSSSSSSTSSDSSGHSLLSACPGKQDAGGARRLPLNSAENLSEDSGYCEPSTLRRSKSKSIPKNFDKLCEEEEVEELMLEQDAAQAHSKINSNDLCQPKIEQTNETQSSSSSTSSSHCSPTSSINSCERGAHSHSPTPSPSGSPSGSSVSSSASAASFTWLRNSLPDIREPRGSSPKFLTDNNSHVLDNNSGKNKSRSSPSSSSSSSAECSPQLARQAAAANASSVPNELQQLGRRRRARRPRNCQSSEEEGHSSSEDLDHFDSHCSFLPRIRRSCSWNAAAGHLNASYQNLTLLDYTDRSENCKRSASAMEQRKQRLLPGDDYEQFICRDNFLLDELSQIYDKNASILNDKTAQEEEEQQALPKTLEDVLDEAPPSSPSPPPQVQHVQLTIRKPPARQKRNIVCQEPAALPPATAPPAGVITFSSFGKTFDQDPTNLRTSYAQSLEQCNLDGQTLDAATSTSVSAATAVRALPKRRFQSSAAKQQRSMVSSTPNLSAFDGGQLEPEDDIYVSSAHNSMHQLPQTQAQAKPLGILLPAGSRNSFSKEVSFCPVVSKYCWQEQSSEEPQEDLDSAEQPQSSDEEEMLDNIDATVIYNTKENENIAARYNAEQQLRAPPPEPPRAEERACVVAEVIGEHSPESDENNENIASVETKRQQPLETSPTPQPASGSSVAAAAAAAAAAFSLESRVVASSSSAQVNNAPVPVTTTLPPRPLSLHLPILSEPPTNRAHHILYASQQLLQRYDTDTATDSGSRNMPKSLPATTPAANLSSSVGGNNNESPVKQRANKSDEKHPSSKSFLSRFAHGLRFSLRRKKKQQQTQQQPQQQTQQQQQQPAAKVTKQSSKPAQSNGKSQDFIHIPLKPPRSAPDNNTTATTTTAAAELEQEQLFKTSTLEKLVTGKPPLPKLPPRQAHAPFAAGVAPSSGVSSAAHASDALLAAEREQYAAFAKQLTSGQRQVTTETDMDMATDSPSRASVAQKTQMFNQLSAKGGASGQRPLTMVTAVPVAVSPVLLDSELELGGLNGKLGLIETNLDTHETVISGKTRSLMDITCNPMHQPHKRYLVKRLNVASAAYDVPHNDDDDDVDIDIDDNERIKTSSQAGGVQIATVRRPHKSMEFLLDKENQKNVLPPENELQKSHDHNPAALSEHQLRVQASLQRLNIPDWFRQYNQNAARSPDGAGAGSGNAGTAPSGGYKPGNFTRKRTQDSGRWQGLNSKTTSLSSLGSQRSDRSPLLLSPSAHSHHGGQSSSVTGGSAAAHHGHGHGQGVGATRWSTSHLNSTQTSPSVSQRGSFARGVPINSSFMSVASGSSAGAPGGVLRNSYRQPYLGWRSTEKLSQRTPHERLANSLLAQRTSPTAATAPNGVRALQPVTPEIQSSIKEVTSAIVHYVNDQTQLQQQQAPQRSRSASPNSRTCWLESSFVGTRPLESPQTPVIDSSSSPPDSHHQQQFQYQQQFHLDATTLVAVGQPPLRMNGLSRVGGGGGESTIYI